MVANHHLNASNVKKDQDKAPDTIDILSNTLKGCDIAKYHIRIVVK